MDLFNLTLYPGDLAVCKWDTGLEICDVCRCIAVVVLGASLPKRAKWIFYTKFVTSHVQQTCYIIFRQCYSVILARKCFWSSTDKR